MSWYRTGTIAVSGTTVTGTGTNWTDNKMGIGPGQALLIPGAGTVKMYEILRVDSATKLTLTSDAGSVGAGQAYAIMSFYTDSVPDFSRRLSAQLSYYQSQMDGWQQIMTSTGTVTLQAPDGTEVTISSFKKLTDDMANKADKVNGAVPVSQGGTGGKTESEARSGLGLGTSSVKNVGVNPGEVVTVASEQLGYRVNLPAIGYSDIGYKGFYGYANLPVDSIAKLSQVLVTNSQWSLGYSFGVYRSVTGTPDTSAFILCAADGSAFSRNWYFYLNGDAVGPGGKLYSEKNTIRSADGTLKAASPVIKLFTDGHAETNAESEGCTVTRKGTGEYLIEGCIGMNADAAWGGIDGGFDIPKDRNRQPLIWLDYDVNPDGSVLVKTYHRTHPDAPAFARNMIGIKNDDGTFDETVKSGEPIDIPADQFVSVRVEMSENSIYNQKRVAEQQAVEAAWKKELRKAEEEALQQDWQREADQK